MWAQGLADKHGFAVVAPTSANPYGWLVPEFAGDPITGDFVHVGRCISWFKQQKGQMSHADRLLIRLTHKGCHAFGSQMVPPADSPRRMLQA